MSDENLRETDELTAINLMRAGYSSREALVASAFLEEKKKWEESYIFIKENFEAKLEELRQSYEDVEDESRIKKFLFNKIAGRLSPAEKSVEVVTKELDNLIVLMTSHEDKKPDPMRYELAAYGNNLFKPR